MSQAVNPHAPPRAYVLDADEDEDDGNFQSVKLFSSVGRVGRLRYLAFLTLAYLLFMAACGMVSTGVALALGQSSFLVGLAVVLLLIPYMVFAVLLHIQRSHDMDWTGWTVLLALIPFVGLLWIFKRGTQGPNRFGAAPPPNTLGVRIFGLIGPVLMAAAVIGIAAAVAIPAYQSYALRATAAQAVKP